MPWSWPAEVTYYEAKAFAKWKAEQDQVEGTPEEYRLLTEAEHHCLRHSTTTTTPSTQLESSSSSTDSNDSNINQQVCNIADNEKNHTPTHLEKLLCLMNIFKSYSLPPMTPPPLIRMALKSL